MGDRTYARFDVGGLSKEQLDNLLQMMDSPDVKAEDDTMLALYEAINDVMPEEVDSLVHNDQRILSVSAYEANYGDYEFAEVKDVCRAGKLPYACYWASGGSYSAGFVWWHPSFGEHGEIQRLTDGEQVVVSEADMRNFLHWFNKSGSVRHGLTLDEAVGVLFQAPMGMPAVIPSCGIAVMLEVCDALQQVTQA